MYFKEIEVKNFRNYEYCKEKFHPEINIFIGKNGQGKTSLAEALYIMCLGRSFRTRKYKDMIKFDKDISVIKSIVEKDGRNIRTELILNRNENKKIKINGISKKKSDLSNNILIVIFSPEDIKIVKEDPDKRRRFINREISQIKPSYYEALVGYTKLLNQRNALLKSRKFNKVFMDVLNEELAKYGTMIVYERYGFIEKLNEISSQIHKDITDNKENLYIKYSSQIKFNSEYEIMLENFKKNLENSYSFDIERGITSFGPHREDLKIFVNEIDVRKYGSQGQQRTAALSLKLAEKSLIEEETGEKPILILDDVFSELDKVRQNYLIKSLKGVQVFLTSTELNNEISEKFENKNIFEIKDGKIINRV